MNSLTEEQLLAVMKKGTNIIVSAGAGSGKTTVLKERVKRIIKDNVDIRNLIILTFTNNAAKEMKERIRTILSNDKNLCKYVEYIDSAYITTFDSFSQSIVKKYGYTINMDKNFTIIDPIIANLTIKRIINEVLENMYLNNENFTSLIENFYVKDDDTLRSNLEVMYRKYTSILDKEKFKKHIESTFFSSDFIEETFIIFNDLILDKRDEIVALLEELDDETDDASTSTYNKEATNNFRYASTYDELFYNLTFTLKRSFKDNYTEKGLLIKKDISKKIAELKKLMIKDKKSLVSDYLNTKKYVNVIYDILKNIDDLYTKYKEENCTFEFNDIAIKAIKILSENQEICDNLKNKTYEIMIDEYQDTNDIQEKFISLIANNNVYMVGDIKQSIYRFRNANPNIFKEKYDTYKNNINGFKIDLNINFRSRVEVIDPINLIFANLMTNDLGKLDYIHDHQMIFGNVNYNNFNKSDYKLQYLEYKNDSIYKDDEIEAFTIGRDILNKIKNNYQITEIKDNKMISRNIMFKDFCILIDKSKNFDLFKKILEYLDIPVSIEKDINIVDDDETLLLSNCIKILLAIKNKKYDGVFKHSFTSLARSYIFNVDDNTIFETIINHKIFDTDIYQLFLKHSKTIDTLPLSSILENIIESTSMYSKMITVGNIDTRIIKVQKFLEKIDALANIYTLEDIVLNLDDANKYNLSIEINSSLLDTNAVKIMTIHKSKGLEYPVVYLPNLNSNFFKQSREEKIILDEHLGIIMPNIDGTKTYINKVFKSCEQKETLYEKIRLFYVAMSRAKENLIIINKINDKDKIKPLNSSKSYHKLLFNIKDILLNYQETIDIAKLNITNHYLNNSIKHYKKKNVNTKINVNELNLDYQELIPAHFSKETLSLIDETTHRLEEKGTLIHSIFETVDFKLVDNIDEEYKSYVYNFLNHEEVKDIKSAKIYKELELIYNDDLHEYHGFIDLMLEYPDHIDIIDYKLSNIDSKEYIDQLNGYKKYIESKTAKEVRTFLYSINQDIFMRINV